ncbi:MAG TPA: hypothetical protein VMW87_16735 [Spirochaetia bacterium]|nr:hypothetical protein [Spirochaetia bacterium]
MSSNIDKDEMSKLYGALESRPQENVLKLVTALVRAKKAGEKVVVITGSGPNIHEGVTTLIAELISKGIVDGVITSSAVVAHEMAGALDRVKRASGIELPVSREYLPRGGLFEVSMMNAETVQMLQREMTVDMDLIERVLAAKGETIIKAAGNMAYPVGLRTERLAIEIESIAQRESLPFELIAGLGSDERTMIGAGARMGVPVLVSVPQLIGGGMVGLAVGDSIPLKRRSDLIARMLAGAQVIVESGIALSQEIHDGPFETYTGHGIWSAWEGAPTYSLEGKTLARIDLDPALEKVWSLERSAHDVQESINKGLPKTKTFKVPFRMEMSGFARLEGSIPIIGDLGVVWPIVAAETAEQLGVRLDYLSAPQESERGRNARDWIVDNVRLLDREKMIEGIRELRRHGRPGRVEVEV